VQLIYVSRAAALGESARCHLLKQARTDNARRQLTGMLISVRDLYIQALEGEAGMVEAVFHTIARDKRHSQITRLLARPIPERLFPAWRLGYWETSSGSHAPKRYAPLPLDIEGINVAAAERLLWQARRSERHRCCAHCARSAALQSRAPTVLRP
jgi:hypothetical protein